MRAVVQRVKSASVRVAEAGTGTAVAGEIGQGFLVLLGVGKDDGAREADWMAEKIARLRVFEDAEGKMNLALADLPIDRKPAVLAVSQFTLCGDASRGRRPDFTAAARPETALPLYERFCERVAALGVRVERGVFGAHMEVALVNDGPVTIILDTREMPAGGASRGE
jgi:D-tyrosyl-tRNA(Tyr) deacylase